MLTQFLKKFATLLGFKTQDITTAPPQKPPPESTPEYTSKAFEQKFPKEKETILLSTEPFKRLPPPPPPKKFRSIDKTTIEVLPPSKPPPEPTPQPPAQQHATTTDFEPIEETPRPPGPRLSRINISFSSFDEPDK